MCFDTILVKQGAQNPVGIRKYPAKLASAGYRVVEGGEGEVRHRYQSKQRRRFKGVTHGRRHREVVQRFEELRIHRI